MGLILDSSVLIDAERKGLTVAQLLKRALASVGDQDSSLFAIALVELAHGIHRANNPQVRARREAFIQELLADVPIYPFTQPIALLAGRIDAEQQAQGVKISIPGSLDRGDRGAFGIRSVDRKSTPLSDDPESSGETDLISSAAWERRRPDPFLTPCAL